MKVYALTSSLILSAFNVLAQQHRDYDIVVVGGTSAGYSAAIQAARLNRTVALLEMSKHVGGIAIEGAGASDIDSQSAFQNSLTVGPLAFEFYRRVSARYNNTEAFDKAWSTHTKDKNLWRFESHVGQSVIEEWMAEEPNLDVFLETALLGPGNGRGVTKSGATITMVRTEKNQTFSARYFIDATYEGDLLAAAAVSYVVGREPIAQYDEILAGIQHNTTFSQFTVDIDPYLIPGDPSSGLIPTVQNQTLGMPGDGDHNNQAFSWRLCLTNNHSNLVPFHYPDSYDRSQYEIYSRYSAAGGTIFTPSVVLPNNKTDIIGSTSMGLGFDMPGRTLAYPEGSHQQRAKLFQELAQWQKGLLYFLANDESLPEAVRNEWSQWGYARDEFVDNDHFPRAMMYIPLDGLFEMDHSMMKDLSGKKDQIGSRGSYPTELLSQNLPNVGTFSSQHRPQART
ncbi:FAD dependent oxidoreductase-domain-containing protein [Aspergillus aurantiobrunneus]